MADAWLKGYQNDSWDKQTSSNSKRQVYEKVKNNRFKPMTPKEPAQKRSTVFLLEDVLSKIFIPAYFYKRI